MKRSTLRNTAPAAMALMAMLWITFVVEAQAGPKELYRGYVTYDIHDSPTYFYEDGTRSVYAHLDQVDTKAVSAPPGPNSSSNSLNMAHIRSNFHPSGQVYPLTNFTTKSSFAIVLACKPGVTSTRTFTFLGDAGLGNVAPIWGIGCDQDSSLVVTSRVPQNPSSPYATSTYRLWDSNMSPSYNPVSKEIDLVVVGSLQNDAKLRLDIFGLLDGRWIANLNDAGWPVQISKYADGSEEATPYDPLEIEIGAPFDPSPAVEEDWFSSFVLWDGPLIESGVFPTYSPKNVNTMTYDLKLYLNKILFASLPEAARDYVPCNSGHWLPTLASKGELGPIRNETFLCGPPPALSGYTQCAVEGATCPPGFLIFGAFEKDAVGNYIPRFVSKSVSQSASCSAGTFGLDPYVGVRKACYRWSGPSDSTTAPPRARLPYEWIACGTGSSGAPPLCNLPADAGPNMVFGALGSFAQLPAIPSQENLCAGSNDPAKYVEKTCFYQRKLKLTN